MGMEIVGITDPTTEAGAAPEAEAIHQEEAEASSQAAAAVGPPVELARPLVTVVHEGANYKIPFPNHYTFVLPLNLENKALHTTVLVHSNIHNI